jgi:hypothetical protein
MDKYLNQSFLIAYEYNESLSEIEDDNFFYFVYPRSISIYNNGDNFHSGNIKINPKIYMSNNYIPKIKTKNDNNDYDDDNWFSVNDYFFRINSNNINTSILSFEHFNYNYFGMINKTFIISLQCYIENNDKKYIINLINFFHQNNLTEEGLSHSLFLLNNSSSIYNPLFIEKYSDNDTFVISQYNITEIAMDYTLDNYFHYGIKDKIGNYYQYGISFDNFDINKMNDISIYYDTITDYNSDILFISPFYLYGKLYQRSKYITNPSVDEKLKIHQFTNEKEVTAICNKFNFDKIIKLMIDYNIDCTNIKIVDSFSNADNQNENENNNDTSKIPYCFCLPLNCLNKSTYSIKEQYEHKNYILVNKIKITNKCFNNFYYFSSEKNKSSGLIERIKNKFLKKEEFQYISFKNVHLDNFPDLSYLLASTINNKNLSFILNEITQILSVAEIQILMTIVLCLFFILIISIFVIINETKKFSKIIYEFNQKYDKYFIQNEPTELIEGFNNHQENKNASYSETEPLIGNKTKTTNLKRFNINFSKYNTNNNYQNSYYLLNELYSMFCAFYGYNSQQLIENKQHFTEKTKRDIKMEVMIQKNELFQLLVKLCSYEPKLNLNIDYNLYADSPLIQYFNNSLKKGKIRNDEEKFTKDVIYEVLSTENICDIGLITNLNFGYITYINLDELKSVKNALFNKGMDSAKYNNFNIKQKLKDDQRKSHIKLLLKTKNVLYNDLQKYYDLDEIKFNKLESFFNQFLLNVYHKYLKNIIEMKK